MAMRILSHSHILEVVRVTFTKLSLSLSFYGTHRDPILSHDVV